MNAVPTVPLVDDVAVDDMGAVSNELQLVAIHRCAVVAARNVVLVRRVSNVQRSAS